MMFRLLLLLCLGHCLPAVVGAVSGVAAQIGASATLHCIGEKSELIHWMFNSKSIGHIKNEIWKPEFNYTKRTHLVSIQKKDFSLVMNSTREEDSGKYECREDHTTLTTIYLCVLNREGQKQQTTAVTPTKGPTHNKQLEGALSVVAWIVLLEGIVWIVWIVMPLLIRQWQRKSACSMIWSNFSVLLVLQVTMGVIMALVGGLVLRIILQLHKVGESLVTEVTVYILVIVGFLGIVGIVGIGVIVVRAINQMRSRLTSGSHQPAKDNEGDDLQEKD